MNHIQNETLCEHCAQSNNNIVFSLMVSVCLLLAHLSPLHIWLDIHSPPFVQNPLWFRFVVMCMLNYCNHISHNIHTACCVTSVFAQSSFQRSTVHHTHRTQFQTHTCLPFHPGRLRVLCQMIPIKSCEWFKIGWPCMAVSLCAIAIAVGWTHASIPSDILCAPMHSHVHSHICVQKGSACMCADAF